MRILVNNEPVIIPSSLSEFTLGQRIDFYNQYGRDLDEIAKAIIEMEEGVDKDIEIAEFQFEKMFRTFAFFAGCTADSVKESSLIDEIASIYYASLAVLMEDEAALEPSQEFVWQGEIWELHPPELKHGDKMSFGELIDSKQVVKDMIEVGKGKWEYMLPVCAIYLRKKGEAYNESFLYEGSERLELMKSLPMDIAMQVGFFLSSSMNICISTFQSFNLPKQKVPVFTVNNTLNGGDGSISSSPSPKRKFLTYLVFGKTASTVQEQPRPSMS